MNFLNDLKLRRQAIETGTARGVFAEEGKGFKLMKEKFKEIKFKPKALELISELDEILTDFSERGYVLTVRQAFYQLVSRNIIENRDSEYKKIGSGLK